MSEVIHNLAKIEINPEFLYKIDTSSILIDFKENFDKLDDLKNAREEYEKTNPFIRIFQRGKLRDAQLDAAEVQANFSKSIGQLMLISIMQSQMLSKQQEELSTQQTELQSQADEIKKATQIIAEQNDELKNQSTRLEHTSNYYFELKNSTNTEFLKIMELHHGSIKELSETIQKQDANIKEASQRLTEQNCELKRHSTVIETSKKDLSEFKESTVKEMTQITQFYNDMVNTFSKSIQDQDAKFVKHAMAIKKIASKTDSCNLNIKHIEDKYNKCVEIANTCRRLASSQEQIISDLMQNTKNTTLKMWWLFSIGITVSMIILVYIAFIIRTR